MLPIPRKRLHLLHPVPGAAGAARYRGPGAGSCSAIHSSSAKAAGRYGPDHRHRPQARAAPLPPPSPCDQAAKEARGNWGGGANAGRLRYVTGCSCAEEQAGATFTGKGAEKGGAGQPRDLLLSHVTSELLGGAEVWLRGRARDYV